MCGRRRCCRKGCGETQNVDLSASRVQGMSCFIIEIANSADETMLKVGLGVILAGSPIIRTSLA